MLGNKSLAGRSSIFFRREVWKVLTAVSQLSASHIKRFRGSDKCGAVFRSIDDFPACFCMGRCLCLEPILPVATPLWRSTCKPYKHRLSFGWTKLNYPPACSKVGVAGIRLAFLKAAQICNGTPCTPFCVHILTFFRGKNKPQPCGHSLIVSRQTSWTCACMNAKKSQKDNEYSQRVMSTFFLKPCIHTHKNPSHLFLQSLP